MKLRDYQVAAVDSIFDYFTKGNKGNPLIAMPPGTGKSVVIASLLERIYQQAPGQRVMMVTHVKELIQQNHERLIQLWPHAPCGIYSASLRRQDIYQSITLAGIGSVAKRAVEFGHIDLIIIDEAHLVSNTQSTMYRKFLNALLKINPLLKVIGLTATPYRLSNGLLTEGENRLFTDICFDMSSLENFNWLISEGYLLQLIPKRTEFLLEVDDVKKRGGEFVLSDLQLAVDRDEITEIALKEILKYSENRNTWLIFTTGIEHTVHTAALLNQMGVPCLPVHSNSKDFPFTTAQRDAAIDALKTGQVRCLVNSNILTTGFDLPGIDLIAILRPTESPGLWVQILGRGCRPVYPDGYPTDTTEERYTAINASNKQNCLVLDFAGNTSRLGPINDPTIPTEKGKGGGVAPVKLCEMCDCYIHASLKHCNFCGHEFIFKTKILTESSNEKLLAEIEEPELVDFKVNYIVYNLHHKLGKPNSIKVSYYCGLRMFTEYVCFGHTGLAYKKASEWWKARGGTIEELPKTADEALDILLETMNASTSVRVWVNKRYPQIVKHCLDNTHFGAEPDNQSAFNNVECSVNDLKPNVVDTATITGAIFDDCDIPF